jgi:hypothetical protein
LQPHPRKPTQPAAGGHTSLPLPNTRQPNLLARILTDAGEQRTVLLHRSGMPGQRFLRLCLVRYQTLKRLKQLRLQITRLGVVLGLVRRSVARGGGRLRVHDAGGQMCLMCGWSVGAWWVAGERTAVHYIRKLLMYST